MRHGSDTLRVQQTPGGFDKRDHGQIGTAYKRKTFGDPGQLTGIPDLWDHQAGRRSVFQRLEVRSHLAEIAIDAHDDLRSAFRQSGNMRCKAGTGLGLFAGRNSILKGNDENIRSALMGAREGPFIVGRDEKTRSAHTETGSPANSRRIASECAPRPGTAPKMA